MKHATKKKAAKKTPKESSGHRGRTSAYAGMTIKKLKNTEESGVRATGKVRECWDAIKDGMSFEKYREKAPDASLARKVLADFIAKKLVKVVKASAEVAA